MKRLLVCLALFVAACSGSTPSAPTGSSLGQGQTPATPTAAPTPVPPAVDPSPGATADALVPLFTLSGPTAPNNCYTAGTDLMRWMLNVSDAGPRHLRFVALAHHDGAPGCEAALQHPRARVEVSGVTDYTPHSSGQTTFTFNPRMYNCGRVQVDVSIFDSAGNEILLIVAMLNYGTTCAPTPNAVVCSPSSGTTPLGIPYTFTATGGTGSYTWSTVPAAGGTPATGSGSTFTQTYTVNGTYVATVSSGGQTASCQVTVGGGGTPDVECRPPTQTAQLNQLANLVAVFGNGVYAWSAPGGTPASGSSANFATAYATPGTKTVSVTSAGVTRTCTVIVPAVEFICAPPTQTVALGEPATVQLTTTAPGPFTWSAPGGSTTTGTGTTFSTSYALEGTKTISVTNGTLTATCQVIVPPPAPLICAPPTQTVNINQAATVTASGGTGTYSWSAPGGSTAAGSGATFSTSYGAAGTNSITVTSGAQTATCQVIVPPVPVPVCSPPTQTVGVNQPANMTATAGDGNYSWSAPGGSITTGTGATFSTSYAAPGSYSVTLSSGGQSSTCQVVVPAPLLCAPPNQTVAIGAPANMSATGGTGTYSWSAPGGSTPSGAGSSFSTSYAGAGSYTVTVTSGGETATCNVSVPQAPPLVCTPPNQTVAVGILANMGATGGTGSYSWSAPGGSNPTGVGASFSTSYASSGGYVVTVTSGAETATCSVTVPPPVVNSCAGTSAVVLDLTPPTAGVRFMVPSGQSANMTVIVTERFAPEDREFTYRFPNVPGGTTEVEVPVPCFSKVRVLCDDTDLANLRGENLCPVP